MADEKKDLQHNVFISWSGPRSQYAAEALRDWLPMVVQAAKPFLSKKDIEKGSRWHFELSNALEVTKVGIVCLTPENPTAPWLLFEAGALSKTVDRGTLVCTYLLAGLQPSDVRAPLSEFQATKAEKNDTRQMLRSINKAIGSPLLESILDDVFDSLWPKLETKLASIPEPDTSVPPKRDLAEMVSEILDLSRDAAKRRESEEIAKRYFSTMQPLSPNTLIVGSPPVNASGGLLATIVAPVSAKESVERSLEVNVSDSMYGLTPSTQRQLRRRRRRQPESQEPEKPKGNQR
jgi:hypothetical protein